MKHFYICLIIFTIIVSAGFTTDIILKKEFSGISASARKIYAQYEKNNDKAEVEVIQNNFYDKKNMLLLFTSKEHIKELETEILLLENAVKYDDMQSAKDAAVKIDIACMYSKRSLTALG